MVNPKIAAVALIVIVAVAGVLAYTLFVPQSDGSLFYSIIVTYSDGTYARLDQTPVAIQPFSVTPLSITHNGKTVVGMAFNLYMTLNTAKTITSWSVTGTQNLEAYLDGQQLPNTGSTMTVSASRNSLNSGETVLILNTPLTTEQISAALSNSGGSGSWAFQCVGALNLSVVFEDGQTKNVYALSPVATIAYSFDGTLSIVSNPIGL